MRRRGGAVAGVLVALLASACGSGGDDPLQWYVASDDFGARALAESCTSTPVEVHVLPTDDADAAHSELVRRLRGDGASIDLLTIAGSAVPELAAAGLIDTVPDASGEGALPAVVEQVIHDGDLYAVPWLVDPYLLWYRSVAAERAGLSMEQPVRWQDLISGAERIGVTIQIADPRSTGLSDWVWAMGAGPEAADVIELFNAAGVGPGPSDTAVASFAGSRGGFLIAPASAAADPALIPLGAEYGVAPYPVIDGAEDAGSPGEGRVLAISADTRHRAKVDALVECLASDQTLSSLTVSYGHVPARAALLEDESVADVLRTGDVLATVLPTMRTADVTVRWNAIRRAIDHTWSPLTSVTLDATATESEAAITAAKNGQLP